MAYPSSVHTDFLEWFKAISTAAIGLTIGAIAVFIASKQKDIPREQREIAAAKLKLDLFHRRFDIFSKARDFMEDALNKAALAREFRVTTPFHPFIAEARFLFGKDIEIYLSQAAVNWANLWDLSLHAHQAGNIVPAEDVDKREKLCSWFAHERNGHVADVFAPYLDFQHWK